MVEVITLCIKEAVQLGIAQVLNAWLLSGITAVKSILLLRIRWVNCMGMHNTDKVKGHVVFSMGINGRMIT